MKAVLFLILYPLWLVCGLAAIATALVVAVVLLILAPLLWLLAEAEQRAKYKLALWGS